MTAKEFVKQHYPNAKAERQVSGRIKGMQRVYWLIRNGRNTMYMAEGNSESNAWVNAKKQINEFSEEHKKNLIASATLPKIDK